MIQPLEDAVRDAGLIPVSWVRCLCRCGEFRFSIPRMNRKRQEIACPRCGKTMWVEETAKGGTKQQARIEAEDNFSHDAPVSCVLWQSDWKQQIEVADL